MCLIPCGLPIVQTRRYKNWGQLCCIHERIYQFCNTPFPATLWAVCTHYYSHTLHTVGILAATINHGQLLLCTFRQSASPATKTGTERDTDSCMQCVPTHTHTHNTVNSFKALEMTTNTTVVPEGQTIHAQTQTDLHSTSPLTQNQIFYRKDLLSSVQETHVMLEY